MYWYALFLLAGIGAMFDTSNKGMVPDIIPALSWIVLALSGVDPGLAVLCFGAIFLGNVLFFWIKKRQAFGWSDILMAPPVIVFAGFVNLLIGMAVVSVIVLGFAVVKKKNKAWLDTYEMPFYAVFFLAMFISLLL